MSETLTDDQVNRLKASIAIYTAVMAQALEDLETWHDEAFSTVATDGFTYASCTGCVTCEKTVPLLKAALEMANPNGLTVEQLYNQAVGEGEAVAKDMAAALLSA